VVVPVLEHDIERDDLEERRFGPKEQPVRAGLQTGGELRYATVVIGLAGCDELVLPELHAHAARRAACFDVEDVCRDRDHALNLSA
jgi:hypothetical protein